MMSLSISIRWLKALGACFVVALAVPALALNAQDEEMLTIPDMASSSSTCPAPGGLYEVAPIVGNLICIPAGTFTQGSPTTEISHYEDETQFPHTLTIDMAVMQTEVTRQMWADLMAVQPSLPADPSDAFISLAMTNPVQTTTWYEAVLFANLLSVQRGLTRCYYKDPAYGTTVDSTNYTTGSFYCNWKANGYRLPSEGEWEYFTRAGTMMPFSVYEPNYGSSTAFTCSPYPYLYNLLCVAWWCGDSSSVTHPAGQRVSNPWNLQDVHGNVWEWCWDFYWKTYPIGAVSDYRGPTSGEFRVTRGGSFNSMAYGCRSAQRARDYPERRIYCFGFRLVRSLISSNVNIANIQSKTSKPGSTAKIYGAGFSKTAKQNVVYFGTRKAKVTKAASTQLTVTIPKKCAKGTVGVCVVVNGQTSNTWLFLVK